MQSVRGKLPKSLILCCALLVFGVSGASGALFTGTGPGSSTIGTLGGEDYATLAAACAAVNTAGSLTGGDWTFFITSNLTETVDTRIGANLNGNTLTIKPAPAATPTINMAGAVNNTTVRFAIGLNADLAPAVGTCIKTENVVIDGSNTVGGTTRDLTFSGVTRRLIGVFGDTDGFTIKNCNFNNGILIRSFTGLRPDNGVIDNCNFNETTLDTTITAAAADPITGWVFQDSTYTSAVTGAVRLFSVNYFTNFTFLRCNLTFTSNNGNANMGFWWNAPTTGTWDSCNITCENAGTGASSGSAFIVAFQNNTGINLYNNFISVIGSSPSANNGGGIQIVSADSAVIGDTPDLNVNMLNNSCIMRNTVSTAATGTARYCLLRFPAVGTGFNGTVDFRNNVVLNSYVTTGTNVLAAPLLFFGTTGTVTSDQNLIFVDTTADADNRFGFWGGTAYATRAAWNAASSKDANSDDTTNPLTGAPGTAKWVSNTDFHFSPEPGLGDTDWQAPAIGAPVTLDKDGSTRGAVTTTRGAIEASAFLDVDSWALY